MKKLTPKEYNSLLQLFEECLFLCLPNGSSSLDLVQLLIYKPGESSREQTPSLPTLGGSSLVQSCLPLFKNLVLFEAAHGDIDKAVALLGRYISYCPKLTQLWTLYAKLVLVGCPRIFTTSWSPKPPSSPEALLILPYIQIMCTNTHLCLYMCMYHNLHNIPVFLLTCTEYWRMLAMSLMKWCPRLHKSVLEVPSCSTLLPASLSPTTPRTRPLLPWREPCSGYSVVSETFTKCQLVVILTRSKQKSSTGEHTLVQARLVFLHDCVVL